MITRASALLPALAFAAAAGAASAACPPADPAAVAGTIQDMYSAVAAGDMTAAKRFTAPDFYIFDGGRRFDGDGIFGLMQGLEQSGAAYTWKVTEPKVAFACETAWITYVNRGGFTKAGQETPLTWLESGVLRYEAGRWKIAFMHSTRVPLPKPAS
jgi:ketosteroid isomerase-like protein